MNKAKLSALCAKARGWHRGPTPFAFGGWWMNSEGELTWGIPAYNPIDDANQADDLLEHVADGQVWIEAFYPQMEQPYCCEIERGIYAAADTKNLAKILCALRASPEVTDAEINDAMEGE